jgi:hypothetical protein
MISRRNAILGTIAAAVAIQDEPSLTTLTTDELAILSIAGPNDEWTSDSELSSAQYEAFHSMIDRGLLVPHPDARWVPDAETDHKWNAYIRHPNFRFLDGNISWRLKI